MSTVLQAERAFRAMGSDAHVLVWLAQDHPVEPEDMLDAAEAEIARFEQLWSRFLPDSDVSRLNAAAGRPAAIDRDTVALLDLAGIAADRTAGRFDPMILPTLLDAGYDRSFDLLAPPSRTTTPSTVADPASTNDVIELDVAPSDLPVRRDIVVDHAAGTARLAPGAAIDLGGIGKGHAADLVAATLVRLGATAACVNLGGDLSVAGSVPGEGLLVGIEDPFGGDDLALWAVRVGGVATSSRLRRRWSHDGHDAHHLIDPATGRPSSTDVVAATVVAPSGLWADVLAKAVLLAPPDEAARLLHDAGAAAIVVRAGGAIDTVGTPPTVAPVAG